jgi:hypothetical protein
MLSAAAAASPPTAFSSSSPSPSPSRGVGGFFEPPFVKTMWAYPMGGSNSSNSPTPTIQNVFP